jgi:predicted transcriptional regulator
MAAKRQQTHAKRARELALRERRERKQAKKAARAAGEAPAEDGTAVAGPEGDIETSASEWVR